MLATEEDEGGDALAVGGPLLKEGSSDDRSGSRDEVEGGPMDEVPRVEGVVPTPCTLEAPEAEERVFVGVALDDRLGGRRAGHSIAVGGGAEDPATEGVVERGLTPRDVRGGSWREICGSATMEEGEGV